MHPPGRILARRIAADITDRDAEAAREPPDLYPQSTPGIVLSLARRSVCSVVLVAAGTRGR
jgi:hypothetical protein